MHACWRWIVGARPSIKDDWKRIHDDKDLDIVVVEMLKPKHIEHIDRIER